MPVTIHDLFGVTRRLGIEQRGSDKLTMPTEYVGVELELEQPNMDIRGDRLRSWGSNSAVNRALVTTHDDGSLRNGIELVFAQPLFGEAACMAIDAMFEIKEANGLEDSVRTSAHVHINYSDTNSAQVIRTLALAAIVEPYVVGTAGTHREANCYAVSLAASRLLITNNCMNRPCDSAVQTLSGGHRYLGFNITALAKYGTIEYRYFGGLSRDGVYGLVNMCLEQKKMSLSGADVRALLSDCTTIREFITRYLPAHAEFLNLTSVSDEDDARYRDDLLVVLNALAFDEAFEDAEDYEVDADDDACDLTPVEAEASAATSVLDAIRYIRSTPIANP